MAGSVGLNVKNYKLFFTYGIVLLPIISQYKSPILSFTDLFIIVALVYFFIWDGVSVNGNITLYFSYLVITTIAMCSLYGLGASAFFLKLFRMILSVVVFYMIGEECFEFKRGYTLYTRLVYLIAGLVIVQYALYLIMGKQTSFLIPNTTLDYMDGMRSNALIRKIETASQYRPSSIFIEPAHQAEFILPWIGYALFAEQTEKLKNTLKVGVVSVALLVGASTTSIVCCAAIWLIYMLYLLKESGYDMRNFGVLLLLAILVAIVVLYLMTVPSIQQQITRKLESSHDTDTKSSFTMRVLRGWYCFSGMDFVHKLFGCGYHSFEYYYRYSGMTTKYDSGVKYISYMSGWFQALCNLGILGFLCYLSYLLPTMWRNSTLAEKMMFATISMLMFGSGLFETPVCILVILTVISSKKRRGVLNA